MMCAHTFDDHIHRLKKTFDSLLHHGLRLKADKCSLAMRVVDFCGHRITSSGLQPIPTNTAAVTNLPVPRSVRKVKAFLGVTGWYRKFIPKYADLVKPLIKLTEKHQEFFWTDDCQVAFETPPNICAGAYPPGPRETVRFDDMRPQSESALNLPNKLRLVHNLWPISVGRCRNPNGTIRRTIENFSLWSRQFVISDTTS